MNDGWRCSLTSGSLLMAGLLLGMTMGLLSAPQSGFRTRRKLQRKVDDFGDQVGEWSEQTKETMVEMVKKGKSLIER